jgi:hypothetical protein
MSIMEKAKERATQLTGQAKEKVDELKEARRATMLLTELGRLSFRQHTGRTEPGDAVSVSELVAQLKGMEAEGTTVVPAKATVPTTSTTTTGTTTTGTTTTGMGSVTGDEAPTTSPFTPPATPG